MRSKAYSFECGSDNKNKLKDISESQSKNVKFEEYYNCLFGEDYRNECDNYVIRSINHDTYLQKVRKNTPSTFDGKRCYKNEIESMPSNWNSMWNEMIMCTHSDKTMFPVYTHSYDL